MPARQPGWRSVNHRAAAAVLSLVTHGEPQAAHGVLATALRVLASPRPPIGLVHAFDVPYHGLIYPSLSADEGRALRDHYRQNALHDIERTLASALAQARSTGDEAPSWKTYVRHGSPRTVIPSTVAKTAADLLVLGTRGHAGVAHALLGTVAGDVLRDVPCDVLVVPPRPQRSAKG